MDSIDRNFVLLSKNGQKLYPFKSKNRTTGEFGFVTAPPGKQDRNSNGIRFTNISDVITRVVHDGWSVRAKKIGDSSGSSYRLNKNSIVGYDISEKYFSLVKSAQTLPKSRVLENPISPVKNTKLIIGEESNYSNVDETAFREIKSRRGQAEFRKSLLIAYNQKCCITGSEIESVLEAAHIIPHSEESNYSVLNGVLLRSDIHTLYDLNLIGIDEKGLVVLSKELEGSEYNNLQGIKILNEIPDKMSEYLSRRYVKFQSHS